MRFWMMIVGTLAGCGVTGIQEADPTRCGWSAADETWSVEAWGIPGSPSEEMDACCVAAAEADVEAGMLAIQALYGPAGSGTVSEDHHEFTDRCLHDSNTAAYCTTYCALDPDYTLAAPDWGGEGESSDTPPYDCDCNYYGPDGDYLAQR